MKKSLLLLSIYWVSLLHKADAQTRTFYYEPGIDIYCERNSKPYQKHSRWNSTSTLLLSMQLNVSDRVIIFNNVTPSLDQNALR